MSPIRTYVFMDLETTGLPQEENNTTKITELSMIAVKREHLLDTEKGLLVVTGVLWGCTNPFIKQGTKGLRQVKADTLYGQACAEIKFLLFNRKYVLFWLVNQIGSLVYLLAVQKAPLSVAVPTANGLAFAFTAITGASFGGEESLDIHSIMGIALIVAGTALCCLESAR